MRIGIEFAKISNGGGERILRMLAHSFAQYDHSIVVFTWNSNWRNEIIEFPHELCILKEIPRWGNGFCSMIELSKAVKRYKVDCLIAFLNTSLRVFIGAAKINHIPIITSLRVEPVFDTFIRKVLKGMLWCCDGIVFQTQKVRNAFSGRIYRNSIVIHNPIMDDSLPFADIDKRDKEIVGIGRLTEQKNFEMLINAFAELRPSGYVLKIYGDGHLRNKLSKQIDNLNVSDCVFLMGHVDKVIDSISKADIFVLSSDWEGMPNALMESMAMGLACIATDVASGGCKDLIIDGYNGMLVPVGDKEALKSALQTVIENGAFKKHIMRNATHLKDSHSKAVIIPQWLSFIGLKYSERVKKK